MDDRFRPPAPRLYHGPAAPPFPFPQPLPPGPSTMSRRQRDLQQQSHRLLQEKAEKAVAKAHQDLLAAGESVSVWQVSQAALLALKADSWVALGLQMPELPSLRALMAVEAKVHAFIHCFVTARGITSVSDLGTAICKNEGIEQFEELAIGPFVKHPLVKHYFSLNEDVSEVLEISAEEIISYLGDYIYKLKGKRVDIEEFLEFLAKKKSVTAKEKLGVRIRSLGLHISFIREARRSEHAFLNKRRGKKQLEENSERTELTQRDILSYSAGDEILGGHSSDSCSDEEDDCEVLDEVKGDEKDEGFSCTDWLKQDMKVRDAILTDQNNYTKKGKKTERARFVMETSALRIFIKTWKEACRKHSPIEVAEKMFMKYHPLAKPKRILTLAKRLTAQPYLGVLNVAMVSIKCGMLDELYDSIGKEDLHGITHPKKCESKKCCPSDGISLHGKPPVESVRDFTEGEIIDKIYEHLSNNEELRCTGKFNLEKRIILLRDLCSCSSWVAEQFHVPEFEALGHGEFFKFLKVHAALLPAELQDLIMGRISQKSNFEVFMLQNVLEVFVGQALNNSWIGEKVTEKLISTLLMNQFPFLSLRAGEGSLDDLLNNVGMDSDAVSRCILFSQTLIRPSCGESVLAEEGNLLENAAVRENTEVKAFTASSLFEDAIEAVLGAPMLSDLNSWTHWESRFAPSLGPLMGWLLNEVNRNDFLCLVTRDGKVIRIDRTVTWESYRQCALTGSPFQMAVQLLSLFASLGGEKRVPLSLLKTFAGRAFDEISKRHADSEAAKDAACKYFIECIRYLPTEFCAFSADVLLSGFKSVHKDAASVILKKCRLPEERSMLHEVGLSLGIVEWIDDYHLFCSTFKSSELDSFEPPLVDDALYTTCPNAHDKTEESVAQEQKLGVPVATETRSMPYDDSVAMTLDGEQDEMNRYKEACLVIEAIRQEEFGLDPGLAGIESNLLKKQHARLGRALHCLSQELYSQDSHFLFELVQNADDNNYPEDVEPTLTFILQDLGVIILNNERGFSSQNIRALCDVGNSTKKGSNAGYIGKKGIGFKSVFRVTDAPEIHSNGFHLKFDISEGQIGFVLPTPVPPLDIRKLCQTASFDSEDAECIRWNTCIVLPFRKKLSQGASMSNINNMFSDLNPSLLLFLHRLQCIMFRNMTDNSLTTMRKEVLRNGLTKVLHGEEEMHWFVVTKKLKADAVHRNVEMTEIALAFTLEELEDGKYKPVLEQQPVFAFLPLRAYGLKFILQADFVLPSSREEVDGDDPWNQWLLSEFPHLFVEALRSFCSLPIFKGNRGEAVTAYMSYVPLIGEVHGFFSNLPRMIIYRLRISDCLLIEGDNNTWVAPCKVLRGWNGQARNLLPSKLLQELLGLDFMDSSISIRDPLARLLGVEEYGLKVLLQVLGALCHKKDGLQSMGLAWLAAWLNEFYAVAFHSNGLDIDSMEALRKIKFIPLSNGTFGSLDEGTIWLQSDDVKFRVNGEIDIGNFPILCSNLRTVDQAFMNEPDRDISTRMLLKLGVQKLSSHDITKLHVMPAICDQRLAGQDKALMVELLCFLAIHMESSCTSCVGERENLIAELRNKAFILTDSGYRRSADVPIHFGKMYGSAVDVSELLESIKMEWHEVDPVYLKHPAAKSFLNGEKKWKRFFHDLGITEFVQVVQVKKKISGMAGMISGNPILGSDSLVSESVANDWESPELEKLLSLLSSRGSCHSCRLVLEVLDKFWEDYFCDKTKAWCDDKSGGDAIFFSSSFVNNIRGVSWIMSSMDGELHYPKDLFHDCDAVRGVLGPSAPYAVPKVKNANLLEILEFKTKVTLEDCVEILRVWTKSETPFNSSILQMSRLYNFMWKENDDTRQTMMSELLLGPFIFLPSSLCSGKKTLVEGSFWSPKDVCWNDTTGAVSQIKEMKLQNSPKGVKKGALCMTLCEVYPGLHDFFVNQCGVNEVPSVRDYFQILQHLSTAADDPSEGAKSAFRILLKLSDVVKSGDVSNEDILWVKDSIKGLDSRVFPTINKKWVSLHPSFGLICWPDDEKLVKEFKVLHKIELLHFGELSDEERELFSSKIPLVMKTLEIPAFSELLTREAIYYGLVDSSKEVSLVDWSLPYTQRYIYHRHPEVYDQLRKLGFSSLRLLQVVVVKTLFYRNIVKNMGVGSDKRSEISSLLQGNTLFVTIECDSHSLFMELSRLYFDGIPDLHLANFLHMIMTMIESGSTEQQVEFFIENSQKIPRVPHEELLWFLLPPASFNDNDRPIVTSFPALKMKPRMPVKADRKTEGKANSNCPPSNWSLSGSSLTNPNSIMKRAKVVDEDVIICKANEVDSISKMPILSMANDEALDISADLTSLIATVASESPDSNPLSFGDKAQLNTGMPDGEVAVQIGRAGELIAFRHFCEIYGKERVKWVNEDSETGNPYDITVEAEGGTVLKYIEVKATQAVDKDWFAITAREWEFAAVVGESFSIAHVLLDVNNTKIRIFKDPVQLCRLRKLQLALLMPKAQDSVM